jgi:hypothetical protein
MRTALARRRRANSADQDHNEDEHGNHDGAGEGRPGEDGDYEKDDHSPQRDQTREHA